MSDDKEVLDELRKATKGLLFMSESDYPFDLVRWDGTSAPTAEFLRAQAGQGADAPVEETTVEDFFRASTSEPDWKGPEELALARKFQTLVGLLGEKLQDVKVYRVGEPQIKVYIVGKGPEGDWLGLSTEAVET